MKIGVICFSFLIVILCVISFISYEDTKPTEEVEEPIESISNSESTPSALTFEVVEKRRSLDGEWVLENYNLCGSNIKLMSHKDAKYTYALPVLNLLDCNAIKKEYLNSFFTLKLYLDRVPCDGKLMHGCYSPNKISIATSMDEIGLLTIFYHEYGHHIDRMYPAFIDKTYWNKLCVTETEYVTEYAKMNCKEDFADTFAYAVLSTYHNLDVDGPKKKMAFMRNYLFKLEE